MHGKDFNFGIEAIVAHGHEANVIVVHGEIVIHDDVVGACQIYFVSFPVFPIIKAAMHPYAGGNHGKCPMGVDYHILATPRQRNRLRPFT